MNSLFSPKRLVILLLAAHVATACANPGAPVGPASPLEAGPGTAQPTHPQPTTKPPASASPEPLTSLTPTAAASGSGVLLVEWNQETKRFEVRPVDPASSAPIAGFEPIGLASAGHKDLSAFGQVLSEDGRWLALAAFDGRDCQPSEEGTACYPAGDRLVLVDLPSWTSREIILPARGYVWPMAFSQDGSRLALVISQKDKPSLAVFSVSDGALLSESQLNFSPSLLSFTLDGSSLILYGEPAPELTGQGRPGFPRLQVIDAASLQIVWEQALDEVVSGTWCAENCDKSHEFRLTESWQPAAVIDRQRSQVYIVHADHERLTAIDLEDRSVRSLEIREPRSWFERLLALTAGVAEAKGGFNGTLKQAVLSPDGQRLYIASRKSIAKLEGDYWITESEALDLKVVETSTGELLTTQPTQADDIRISPDGRYLMLYGWDQDSPGRWTEVLDSESLKRVAYLEDWEVQVAYRLDGQPVVLGFHSSEYANRLALLEPETFDVIGFWTSKTGPAFWVTRTD